MYDDAGGEDGDDPDDRSSDGEGLQLDIDCATPREIPVTYSRDDVDVDVVSPVPFPSPGLSPGDSARRRPERKSYGDGSNSNQLSHLAPSAWRREEGDDERMRKNTNSLESKRKIARMKALAMKERASSALAAKADKARERVHRLRAQRERRPDGMEITTGSGSGVIEAVSQVSNDREASEGTEGTEGSDRVRGGTDATPRKHRFQSKVLSQIAGAKSKNRHGHAGSRSVATAASAVSSMRDKASSALSQKAQRARERTVGMVVAGSPLVRARERKHAAGTNGNSSATFRRDDVVSLLSMEDSVGGALAPSECGGEPSEGPYVAGAILPAMGPVASSVVIFDAPGALVSPPSSFASFASPPPPSAHRPSECIDRNGFLVSPAASVDGDGDVDGDHYGSEDNSFDPNSFLFLSPLSTADMDDPDYGMPDLLSRSNGRNADAFDAEALDAVAGAVDDGAVAGADGPGATTASGRSGGYSSRLMPRLPPSPRLLPPSGKRMMRKAKGAARRGNGGYRKNPVGVAPRRESGPPPLGHRTSSF